MKKLFLTLALALGMFAANAQVWIGGSTSAFVNENYTKFAIAPEVGYCFTDSPWCIAIGANYTFAQSKALTPDHGLILSPYVRYSLCTIKNNEGVDKFAMFLDLTGDFDVISKDFGYRVGLQPGIAWMATKHWTAAFRFAFIGYNHCDYYINPLGLTPDETEYGFKCGFAAAAPSLGLYYNF